MLDLQLGGGAMAAVNDASSLCVPEQWCLPSIEVKQTQKDPSASKRC
jgi:hypothetical protein